MYHNLQDTLTVVINWSFKMDEEAENNVQIEKISKIKFKKENWDKTAIMTL